MWEKYLSIPVNADKMILLLFEFYKQLFFSFPVFRKELFCLLHVTFCKKCVVAGIDSGSLFVRLFCFFLCLFCYLN